MLIFNCWGGDNCGGSAVLFLVLSLPQVPVAALSLPPAMGFLSLLVGEGVVHIYQLLKYDHKHKMNLHGILNMGQHSLSLTAGVR